MSPTAPKPQFPIVRLAIGLVCCSSVTMLLLAIKIRQNQCVQLMLPIELNITVGNACPRTFSR